MSKDELISHLFSEVKRLTEQFEQVTAELEQLRKENAILKSRIRDLEVKKTSQNSSVPPAKDENRPKKTKSLRAKSGRKPGGQPGHEGHTLEMVQHPNEIIGHHSSECRRCGKKLAADSSHLVECRQVVDIPVIRSLFTEHRIYQSQCSCGQVNTPEFPAGVQARISYGPVVESLVGYLHCRQYVPYERMAELLNEVMGLSISQAGIGCLLARLTKKAMPVYDQIKDQIQNSSYVGSDETGLRINGNKHWAWTW